MDETNYYFSFLLITIKEVATTRRENVFLLRTFNLTKQVRKHARVREANFSHRTSIAHNSKNNWNAQPIRKQLIMKDTQFYSVINRKFYFFMFYDWNNCKTLFFSFSVPYEGLGGISHVAVSNIATNDISAGLQLFFP